MGNVSLKVHCMTMNVFPVPFPAFRVPFPPFCVAFPTFHETEKAENEAFASFSVLEKRGNVTRNPGNET